MGKFQRSWTLFKASMSVIFSHKQLMLFPIVISALMVVIVLFFLAPVALMPTGHSVTQVEHWKAVAGTFFRETKDLDTGADGSVGFTPAGLAYLVFLYLATMFCATFFNVAFYNEILAALQQQPVSIARGLKFAATRLKAILMWSLLAGVIGLLIKTMEQRFGLVGKLVVRLVGVAWSIASVFAIPIIVQDEQATNPVKTVKKSAAILRKTWGEALIGYVGLSFASGIVVLGSLVFLAAGVFVSIAISNFWIMAVVGLVWFIGIVAFSYMLGLAGQVYKGALYLYAANGVVAQPYSQEMFASAWKFKKQK